MNKALGLNSLCVLILLSACGVKKREFVDSGVVSQSTPGAVPSKLPPGVVVSDRGKLFMRYSFLSPSTTGMVAGEENVVAYRVIDENFAPVVSPTYDFASNYRMPSMPEMTKKAPFHGTIEKTATEVKVTYDIVHGKDWELQLQVLKEGKLVDTFTHLVWVPLR